MTPPALTLRPAAEEDLEAIAALWHRAWNDGHLGHVPAVLHEHRGPDEFRRRVPPRLPTTTVAEREGQLLGFVTVRDDELEQLFVDAPARGSGAAVALLQHAERVIAKASHRAWLAVVEGNHRARRFYARCGWTDAGAFDYQAEVDGGWLPIPCRRYEKDLTVPAG